MKETTKKYNEISAISDMKKNREAALKFFSQFTKCKPNEFTKIKTEDELYKWIISQQNSSSSYRIFAIPQNTTTTYPAYIYLYITYKLTQYFYEDEKLDYITLFDVICEKNINLNKLLKIAEGKAAIDYFTVSNLLMSLYFSTNNFEEYTNVINSIIKYYQKNNKTTKTPDFMYDMIRRPSLSNDSLKYQYFKAYIYLIMALRKLKIKIPNNILHQYSDFAYDGFSDCNFEILFEDNFIKNSVKIINKEYGMILKKYFNKNSKYNRYSSSTYGKYDTNPSLSLLETDPYLLGQVISSISEDLNEQYDPWAWLSTQISNKTDRRISLLLSEIKANPERFAAVIKNYLYSTYGTNQKTSGLETCIKKIQSLITLSEVGEEINLISIVGELPDKIQIIALAAII